MVRAQVTSATLTGVVRDATGASIPEAKITITNIATNISREASSDAAGNYTVPSLVPGEYRVEAEKSGFKKAVLTGVILQVAQQGVPDPFVVQHPAGDQSPADRSVGPDAQQQTDAGDFTAVVDAHGHGLDVQDRHLGACHLQFVGGQPARRGFGHVRHCLIILSAVRASRPPRR